MDCCLCFHFLYIPTSGGVSVISIVVEKRNIIRVWHFPALYAYVMKTIGKLNDLTFLLIAVLHTFFEDITLIIRYILNTAIQVIQYIQLFCIAHSYMT